MFQLVLAALVEIVGIDFGGSAANWIEQRLS